ncbi:MULTISPECIES: hypothetical protein [unclassified Streptomyces]|uniref:hypothetical protein n=1 Tax=unclassified Streptomyces TaxID=2593676 RepID=UPI00381AA009
MSEQPPAPRHPSGSAPAASARGGPEPEAIRFFGTTWVGHDPGPRGYAPRRVAVAVGSLATATAACCVLRFAYEGLEIAAVGSFTGLLVVVMFAVCSSIAFRRTWDGYTRRPADPAREESLRGVRTIGFIGSLLAYFLRSLTEAPGEGLRRREYETAGIQYERRAARRNASPRKPGRRRG